MIKGPLNDPIYQMPNICLFSGLPGLDEWAVSGCLGAWEMLSGSFRAFDLFVEKLNFQAVMKSAASAADLITA